MFARLRPSRSIYNTGRDRKTDVLFKLYCKAFANSQTAICSVLKAIANADNGMVLFHCAVGKDRTGVIAALMLLGAGIGRDIVLEDYALTTTLTMPWFDQLVKDAIARCDDGDVVRSLPEAGPKTTSSALDHLDETYCGVRSYPTAA